jgi:hypothetical protein
MWLATLQKRWFGKSKNPKGRRSQARRGRRKTIIRLENLEDRTLLTSPVILTVNNGDVTTLIQDIGIANNNNNQQVIISLATNGTYNLTSVNNTTSGPNGLPVITATNLTIEGNGSTIERLPGITSNFRIFDFGKGANVTVQDLTIADGKVVGQPPQTPAAPGLGAQATLFTTSTNAGAPGGAGSNGASASGGGSAKGGGIYASGATLTLSNVTVTGNIVEGAQGGVGGFGGNGAGGSPGPTPAGAGGNGGKGGKGGKAGTGGDADGGGIYVASSTLVIENNTTIRGNQALGGTGGVGGFGGFGGSGGAGGAGSTADPQGGPGGKGGKGGSGGKGGVGGDGGNANGGGLYALDSQVTIVQGSVKSNSAAGGQGGIGGFGGGGGPGGAGGAGGQGLSPPPYGKQGKGGEGGEGGEGGDAGDGGDGGNAKGGGIYTLGGSLKLLTASVLTNKVTAGASGPGGIGGAGGTGGAGGSGSDAGEPGGIGNAGGGGGMGKPGTASDNPDILKDSASAPLFVSASDFTFTEGQSNTFAVKTHGYPLPTLTESGTLPDGVTFTDNGNGTATLSGTPQAGTGGVYTLTFTAQNGVNPNATQTFTLTVQEAPSITTPNSDTFTVGQSGSFSVNTSGYPNPQLKITGGLPAGVTFKDNGNGTATLQGTPVVSSGGIYKFTITAHNGIKPDATQNFTLTVEEAPRIISSAQTAFALGSKGSFTVTTVGFPKPTLTEKGALPSGVTFTDNGNGTATLSGTPAVGTDGNYRITITAHNGQGADATQSFALVVGQAPTFNSDSTAYFAPGQSGSFTVQTSGPPTAALTETGKLPSGFTFTDNGDGTATISGTPAAGTAGTSYPIIITANNGLTATQVFTISIGQPPTFTNSDFANFADGQSNSATISTNTGTAGPIPTLTETGALPSGITFKDNGDGTATLSGTPAAGATGAYTFTITANNGFTTTQQFTLNLGEAPTITSGNVVNFSVGQSSSFTVTTTGTSPITLSIPSFDLPQGLSSTDNGNGTGTISGTPAAATAGSYDFTIEAYNTFGTVYQNFTLNVSNGVAITSSAYGTMTVGQNGSITITTTGTPTPSLTESGSLPSGVTFTDNGNGTATLSGTPAASMAGTYDLTLTATSGTNTFNQNFTLTVQDAPKITSATSAVFGVGNDGSFYITTYGLPGATVTESGTLPQGLTFYSYNDGNAEIAGTPADGAVGTYKLTFTATNSLGSNTQNFTLIVGQFTNSSTATFTVGQAGTFNITTTGFPNGISLNDSAFNLPQGLTFTDNGNGTATITGTPAASTGGSYTFPINVVQGTNTLYTQDLNLVIDDAPQIQSANSTFFTVGQSDSFEVSTYGLPAPALTESGTLPSGITFTDNGNGTAYISGTPTASEEGSYNFTITAKNSLGSNTQNFTLIVGTQPMFTSTSAAVFTVGQSNSFTVTTTGTPTAVLSTSSTLPSGVTFKDNGDGTATLSGTPAAGSNGTYGIYIDANNGSDTVDQYFNLIVGTGVAFTNNNTNPTFLLGQNNSYTVTTVGSPTASLSESGTLPSGVTFKDNGDGTGTLSGTPAAGTSGSYSFSITANDGVDSPVTQYYDLNVYATTQFTSAATTGFLIGQYNDFTITTSYDSHLGYYGPTLTETGALPSGVSFSTGYEGTASLSGYPDSGTAGTYNITITAVTGNGIPDVTQNFTLVVGTGSPTITSAANATLTTGVAGSFTITTSGSPTASITESGALPTGVTLTDNGDGTATLGGTAASGTAGAYKLTITAHNGDGTDATQTFNLTVATAPAITSANSTTFTAGQAGSFTVTTSGSPTASLTESGNLPNGVTFTDNGDGTATISGTPTDINEGGFTLGVGGTYAVTITAQNGGTPNATQTFTLTVNEAPEITSASNTIFSAGSPNAFLVTTAGFPKPTLTESGTLPSGVTFTDNGDGTATLSGTPTLGEVGTYNFTLTAKNSQGSVTQGFLLVVGQAPVFTSNVSTVFGVGQSGSFTVTTNGVPTASLTETGALPSGVTFKDNGDGTATLSGTPAAGTAGMYALTFTAANNVGIAATQTFFLLVGQAPAFTSAASATFGLGGSGSFTITTSGSPSATLTESGTLPSGLTFADNGDGTATLSGTPAAGTAGTYDLTLTAHNGASADVTQNFTLTVSGQAPVFTSGSSDSFTVGQSGSFTVTTTSSPTAALTVSGNLPSGITFKDNGDGTATLSGTPVAGMAGTYNLVFTATGNGTSSSTTQDFTLSINDAPKITSATSTSFAVGAASSFTVTTYGYPTASLSESGSLPTGVTFTDNGDGTATLSGTPATGTNGTYNLTITAHNGQGSDYTQNFTLTVGAAQAPTITSAASDTLTVGQAGSFTITTTGLPTTGLTEAGRLPSGVTFTDNGDGTATLSGTPAAGTAGTYALAITAANGTSPSATQNFTLLVNDAPQITSSAQATFYIGRSSTFTVATYGFPSASLTESGSLPKGVTFTDNGDGTATISGTPASGTNGTYSLTITAHNGQGNDATQSFALTVANPPHISFVFEGSTNASFVVGQSGSFTISTYSGTSTPFQLSETGTLPSGLTFKDNGDGTATISGTPAAGAQVVNGGTYNLTVTASGGPTETYSQGFVLTVVGPPSITSANNATFYAGQYSNFSVTTVGEPYSDTVTESGVLPSGISFYDDFFSGTPAPGTANTYNLTLTATNSYGSSSPQNFTLTVEPAPSEAFSFTENQSNSVTINTNIGGTPSLTESGALPAGVTFTDNGNGTATLSGTPQIGTHGTYLFTVTATSGSSSQTQSYILTVGQQSQSPRFTSKASAFFTLGQYNYFGVSTSGYPFATVTESGALPQGVTFSGYYDSFYGKPAAGTAGVYNITLTAHNGVGPDATQDFALVVGQPPSIDYTSGQPDFTVGQVGSYTFTANSNNPPVTFTEEGVLPKGLAFTDNGNGTASIAGIAADGTAGAYTLAITVSNGVKQSTQFYSVNVSNAGSSGLAFTSANAITFAPGDSSSFEVTASGPVNSISIQQYGTLPAGVTFQSNGVGTATLSGTPAAGSNGTYNLLLVASDYNGNQATQNFTLTVGPGLAITSSPTGTLTAGQNGSVTITTGGGAATPSLTESGRLPSGVTFKDNGNGTATLSGTPAANDGGTYNFVLTANDGVDPPISQQFTLIVNAAPQFVFYNGATDTGGMAVGQYSQIQLNTTGFPAATITESGALPSGVTFTDSGYGYADLSGTPATGTSGTYNLVFTASNGIGSAVTQDFTLTVGTAPAITSANSTTFTAGQSGSFTITTSGSPAPSITEIYSNLPTGVTFKDNGDGTGTISGTPAAGTGGTYRLDLEVQNGIGYPNYQYFTLTVDEAPQITSNANTTFLAGQYNSFSVTTTGYPSAKLTETGTLPSGVTFDDNGFGTGYLSGRPASGATGTYQFTITADGGSLGKVTQNFTLNVDQTSAFTSGPGGTFTVGQSGSVTITNNGAPTNKLIEHGALPAGLTFTDNGNDTATISGTPAAGTGGAYSLSLTAQNGVGLNANQTFFLFIDQPAAITSATSANMNIGLSNNFTITTSGFPSPTITESGTLPTGVTFTDNGNGTATLSGTPAAGTSGSYSLTITAHNGIGSDYIQSFTLNVGQGLAFTSATNTSFTLGQSNSFTITTAGTPTPSITESGTLPSGVSFKDNGDGTATLSGTPAAGTAGTYSLTLTAHNGVASDQTQTFTLTVGQPASITTGNAASFTAGQAGSFTVKTSGFPTPTLTESGALPSGVTFKDNGDGTATLSGTPAANSGGTYALTITAHNGIGSDDSQSLILTVNQAASITSAASTTLTVGQSGSFTVTTSGFPTPSLTESGALPLGVTFKDNGDGTAALSGTPAATSGGTYALTITAHNGIGSDNTQSFTLTVNQAATITSNASTSFAENLAGSFTVTTSGFPTPTIAESGTLPTGVTFKDNGDGTATLSGTPAATSGGTYALTITAHNGVGADYNQTFTLTVGQPPAITSSNATSFTAGQSGSFTITTSGFPTPTLTESGALPSGVTFKDNGDGTATLSGTPAANSGGTYALTITAHNGVGSDNAQSFALTVNQAAAITSSTTAAFSLGQPNSFTITTSGFPKPSLSVSGTLPTGVTFKDNGDGTATLSGTPVAGTAGTFNLTITAHNGIGSDVTQGLALIVGPPPASSVNPLPSTASSPSFTVSWSGSDVGGPGIASFTIYVSDNGGAFTPWLTNTTLTSATYNGQAGHSYGFYSVATDAAGRVQLAPSAAQASTFVPAPPSPPSPPPSPPPPPSLPTALSEGFQSLSVGFALLGELPVLISSAGPAQAGELFSAALSLVGDEVQLFGDLLLGLEASLFKLGPDQTASLAATISALVADIQANPLVNGGKSS